MAWHDVLAKADSMNPNLTLGHMVTTVGVTPLEHAASTRFGQSGDRNLLPVATAWCTWPAADFLHALLPAHARPAR